MYFILLQTQKVSSLFQDIFCVTSDLDFQDILFPKNTPVHLKHIACARERMQHTLVKITRICRMEEGCRIANITRYSGEILHLKGRMLQE